MSKDPWTDPDPQPGDFDADLAMHGHDDAEAYQGDPDARLTIVADDKPRGLMALKGAWKGHVGIPDDFDELPEDLQRAFCMIDD